MRAADLVVRLGADRDVLVLIGCDSDTTVRVLRERYAAWLDDSMLTELADERPAFAVHLGEATGEGHIRSLPHLRSSNEVLARGTADAVLEALDRVLGDIRERRPDDERPWVSMRVFTKGTSAVLTDLPRPHLVADRQLLDAGIREVVNWGIISDGRHVTIAPPLHSDVATQFEVVGTLTFEPEPAQPAERLVRLASRSTHPAWFEAVATPSEHGEITTVSDRQAARRAILQSFPDSRV